MSQSHCWHRQTTHSIKENEHTALPTNTLLPFNSQSPFSKCSVLMGWTLNFFLRCTCLALSVESTGDPLKEKTGFSSWFQCTVTYFFLLPYIVPLEYIHYVWCTQSLATSSPNPSLVTMLSRQHQLKHCTHQAGAVNRASSPSAHPPNSLDPPTLRRVVSSASSYTGTIPSNFVLADSFSTATTSLPLPASWRAINRCAPHRNTATPAQALPCQWANSQHSPPPVCPPTSLRSSVNQCGWFSPCPGTMDLWAQKLERIFQPSSVLQPHLLFER